MYQKSFSFYFKFALLQKKKLYRKTKTFFIENYKKITKKKSLITKAAFTGVYTV